MNQFRLVLQHELDIWTLFKSLQTNNRSKTDPLVASDTTGSN
jgi:hypothetical protein